jgi:hypothetical protein
LSHATSSQASNLPFAEVRAGRRMRSLPLFWRYNFAAEDDRKVRRRQHLAIAFGLPLGNDTATLAAPRSARRREAGLSKAITLYLKLRMADGELNYEASAVNGEVFDRDFTAVSFNNSLLSAGPIPIPSRFVMNKPMKSSSRRSSYLDRYNRPDAARDRPTR